MKECYACDRTETYKWYHFVGDEFLCGKCYHHYRVGKYSRQTNQVIERSCYSCGNDKPKGFWHINHDINKLEIGSLCDICFQKYFNKPRRISMKRRRMFLSYIPEKVKNCEKCGKVSNSLNGHHEQYFIIFPWAFRVFLCSSCHAKETINLGQNNRDIDTGLFIGGIKS